MNTRLFVTLAASGSAALLLGAFAFQYLGGLAPCPLCVWQRWPHAAAVAIGIVALVTAPRAWLAGLGALAASGTAGIGFYHTGIERGWWQGPTSCTGDANSLSGLSGADLLSTDAMAPLVMCDQVAWSLAGLSMASWNMLASLGLAGLWTIAAMLAAHRPAG